MSEPVMLTVAGTQMYYCPNQMAYILVLPDGSEHVLLNDDGSPVSPWDAGLDVAKRLATDAGLRLEPSQPTLYKALDGYDPTFAATDVALEDCRVRYCYDDHTVLWRGRMVAVAPEKRLEVAKAVHASDMSYLAAFFEAHPAPAPCKCSTVEVVL